MTVPLMILALLAAVAAWNVPFTRLGHGAAPAAGPPAGIAEGVAGGLFWPGVAMPAEHLAHVHQNAVKAEWAAFGVALAGFIWRRYSTACGSSTRWTSAAAFIPVYGFSVRKWMFDELYAFCFVRPVLRISGWVAAVDRKGIDWLVDNSARTVEAVARLDDWIDRVFVDSAVNLAARWTYALGMRLRAVQTGSIRQYVLVDRRGHRGAVRVDEFVLELCRCRACH